MRSTSCSISATRPTRRGFESVDKLARLCDQYLIPMATNAATAEVLIQGLRRGDFDWRDIVNPRGTEQRRPRTRCGPTIQAYPGRR